MSQLEPVIDGIQVEGQCGAHTRRGKGPRCRNLINDGGQWWSPNQPLPEGEQLERAKQQRCRVHVQ